MFKSSRSKSMKSLSISSPMLDDCSSIPPTLSIPPTPPAPCSASQSITNSKTISDTPAKTPNSSSVILITKFDFKAESRNELTFGVGEAFKLIERKGNGWILAKPIGRISEPGLIPASYVRIFRLKNQVSDEAIDEKWLAAKEYERESVVEKRRLKKTVSAAPPFISQRIISPIEAKRSKEQYSSCNSSIVSEDEQHFSFQSAVSSSTSRANSLDNSFCGIQGKDVFPVTALVRNASSHNGRYWYRVDVTMNNGIKRYLCRYYQDFYKLHCSIVERLKSSPGFDEENNNPILSLLPSFPDPIPRPDLQTLSSILLQRCQMLNVYIFRIVQNKHRLDYCQLTDEWIKPRLGDLEVTAEESMPNEKIEEYLKPLPAVINKDITGSLNESTDINSSEETAHVLKNTSSTIKNPQNLKISTSMTPPLPAPNSLSQNHSKSCSLSLNSSPSIWYSPVTQRQSQPCKPENPVSSPTIHEGKEKFYTEWLNSPTEPLFSQKQPSAGSTKFSSPTQLSFPVETLSELVKIKVFSDNDIFALKVKRTTSLKELKKSILTRLERDFATTVVKLYYKDQAKNCFTPLVGDSEISTAFDQAKIIIKVHIWTSE